MKTAPHSTYRGPGRIVISLGSPRGAPAGYKLFKALAPKREWMHAPASVYVPLFKSEILDPLDPQIVWNQLHAIHPGIEPVLQCFERPAFTAENFCHRRLVAQYFERELGVKVPEIDYDGPDGVTLPA